MLWFFRGTEGKCRGGDLRSLCGDVGTTKEFPPLCPKIKKEVHKAQDGRGALACGTEERWGNCKEVWSTSRAKEIVGDVPNTRIRLSPTSRRHYWEMGRRNLKAQEKRNMLFPWLSGRQSGRGEAVLRVRSVCGRAARVSWRTDVVDRLLRRFSNVQILTGFRSRKTCREIVITSVK